MRKKALLLSLIIIVPFLYVIEFQNTKTEKLLQLEKKKQIKRENLIASYQQQFLMLRDPNTNEIPKNIYSMERQFLESIPVRLSKASALNWIERGPNNTSGRIRGMAIDVRTTSAPNVTIIAGGVSGGLWKSTNNGDSWTKTTNFSQLHSVTCVVQDTRQGKQDIWYAGSGEQIGNSSASPGDGLYLGDGVFKSTNNGNSWTLLQSTQVNSPNSWTSDWQYVWRLAIDKNNAAQDVVYAATTGGVYRTQDGGTNWTKVLAAGTNQAVRVDIATADNGTLYVASSSIDAANNTIKGIRKSTDGGNTFNNITPPNMPDEYGRIILAIAPSNQNILYFFVQGVNGNNSTPSAHGHQLWRSTDAGATWSNISSVLPSNTAPDLDNFSTQDGYDMILNVKPDNPNFVIFGGVSLFKVHDVTNDNLSLAQKHIGGYGMQMNGTANALNDFKNHHPDQHTGMFLPGSNDIFYCGNDGGVHIANDISKSNGMDSFWQLPKRNGLNITQFYSISIAPESGSAFLAGGLQDRGNWMARNNNNPANWQEVSGGDGTIAQVAPDALNTVFQATTNGNIFRYSKSDSSSPVANTTPMKPNGSTNVMFVNPFVLDPNNGNILYFAGGNNSNSNSGVWRNTSATTATETDGWQFLSNSEITNTQVTAFGVSQNNNSNILYYGTSNGKVYRLDGANSGDPAKVEITSPNFPQGYVNCISVDPTNSSKALVVFSNYNIDRLWYTTDSGNSWTSVSGNLNGASGPSVRWGKIFYVNNQLNVFLATSVGVYYTNALTGNTTNWLPEAQNSIGNVVCIMLDFRSSDNTLVVATHGRGAFEAKFTTGTSAPSSPTNLTSAVSGSSQINLTWQDNANDETGYKIERRTSQSAPWNVITTISANVTSYNDTQLTDGTKYYYRVYAFNSAGNSGLSNEVNATTIMKAPTNLTAQIVNNSQVSLNWVDNSESETAYSIERKQGQSGQFQLITDVNSNSTSYIDQTVSPGQQYFYRVRGFNANTNSAFSNEADVSIIASGPSSPTNLAATASSSSQINLTWQDNANDESGYKIDRRLTTTAPWVTIATTNSNVTSYSDTQLIDGTKYFYRVYAFNSNGNSNFSNDVNAITTMNAPTNLVLQVVGNSQVSLSWNDNSQSETGYTVERKISQSGQFTKLTDVNSNITSYTDASVVSGQQYFYRVRGFNSNTTSSYSNEVNVTITSIADEGIIPKDFALYQNYPNPFNPTTTIKFAVPSESNVNISIYDINGNKITTILNSLKSPGFYTTSWNGKNSNDDNVTSGIYFYTIKAQNFTQTRKMLLIK
jgi:photosystem II stability/assembly factor-like uncharacterized protein